MRDTSLQENYLKLLRIEMENYSHPHDNRNVLNRTSMDIFIQRKLMRKNIDCYTLNNGEKIRMNLVIWGRLYEVMYGWQANFESPQEVHKRGRLKIK
jgi:hypothetical protein